MDAMLNYKSFHWQKEHPNHQGLSFSRGTTIFWETNLTQPGMRGGVSSAFRIPKLYGKWKERSSQKAKMKVKWFT